MSRTPRFALFICILVLIFANRPRAAELPQLWEDAELIVHLDLAKLDGSALMAAAKSAMGPMAAMAQEKLNEYELRRQEAMKAGVLSITLCMSADAMKNDGMPVGILRLKEGSDPVLVGKIVQSALPAGQEVRVTPMGNTLQVFPVGAKAEKSPPRVVEPMNADRAKRFTDAAAGAGDAAVTIIFSPGAGLRNELGSTKLPEDAPAPVAALVPPLTTAKSLSAGLTLGAAQALVISIEAADETNARLITQRINDLMEMAQQKIVEQAGEKATAEQLQVIKGLLAQLKPVQSVTQIRVTVDAAGMAVSSAVLLPAIMRAREMANAKAAGTPVDVVPAAPAVSTTVQPLGTDLDFLPPPSPWVFNKDQSGADRATFYWRGGARHFIPEIMVWALDTSATPPASDFAANMAQGVKANLPPHDELTVAPEVVIDPRFAAKVHYSFRKGDSLVDTLMIYRRVGSRMVVVTAVAEGDIDLEKKTHAINRLADDVALSMVPRGKTPPVSVAFDLKALQGRRGEGTEDAQPTMATPPPAVKTSGGGSAARANTAVPVKAVAPVTPAPAAAPAAGSLAAARQLKAKNPAEAYAALKAIVKASPTSADGKAAAQDLAAMEQDAAISKKIMTAEGKAYSSFSMAQNFQNSGQGEKAQQRYEQIIKDFPDTMSAAVAQKKLAELKAGGSK